MADSIYRRDPRPKAAPRNTSAPEQEMRTHIGRWARERWGDVRILHELALGDRRIDMVVVGVDNLYGIEVKGPRDSLGDGRLPAQMKEFSFYLPEVWLALHPKWIAHKDTRSYLYNRLFVDHTDVRTDPTCDDKNPRRDDLCCSRLLELLWSTETEVIAQRTGVIPGLVPSKLPTAKVRAMLARLLTGHQIVKEVCRELRSRPLVGLQSDDPMRTEERQ